MLIFMFATTVKAQVSNSLSEWLSQELSRSDRPELTAANVVVSGGEMHVHACI